ncbi:8-oxoguanine glycosylase ogg1, partial [Tulasnella sp. 403]
MHIPSFRSIPLSISQLNLSAVLRCGQSFRWECRPIQTATLEHEPSASPDALPGCEWRLSLQDRVICLRQTSSTLYYRALFPTALADADEATRHETTLSWLQDYFQLDVDLLKLYAEWSTRDPVFKRVRDRFSGIRILRQDPWENVISFICSQNNHISRISSMVQNLCIHFSPPLLTTPAEGDVLERTYHPFPSPDALRDPSAEGKLRDLGFGYRAKYIQKTAAYLCETYNEPLQWLLDLRRVSTEDARGALLQLSGVGPKVADCILLMSLDK